MERSSAVVEMVTLASSILEQPIPIISLFKAPSSNCLVFLAGGDTPPGYTASTEIVDLCDGSGPTCEQPEPFPFVFTEGAGLRTPEGNPLVCGGSQLGA